MIDLAYAKVRMIYKKSYIYFYCWKLWWLFSKLKTPYESIKFIKYYSNIKTNVSFYMNSVLDVKLVKITTYYKDGNMNYLHFVQVLTFQ